jgi:hypothetical protein
MQFKSFIIVDEAQFRFRLHPFIWRLKLLQTENRLKVFLILTGDILFVYIIYICNNLEIGTIAGVAAGTIQQTYKLMLPQAKELFPEDFKFEVAIDSLPQS